MIADTLFILYIIALVVVCFFIFNRKYNFVWLMNKFDMWPTYFRLNRLVGV